MSAMAAEAVSDAGAACAELFDMAARESMKAWQTTALLARVRTERMEELLQVFGASDPAEVSRYLSNVGGTPFDGYAMKSGADAGSLMRMGLIIMRAICRGLPPASDVDGVLDSLATIYRRTCDWIVHGRFEGSGEELAKIAQLMGEDPRARLGLMAPFSPSIAITQFIARASKAQYPFQSGNI